MVGEVVLFTDEHRDQHKALVTVVHGPELGKWCVNLVYVSTESGAKDQYGQQLIRKSSVPPQTIQQGRAGGYYYEPI